VGFISQFSVDGYGFGLLIVTCCQFVMFVPCACNVTLQDRQCACNVTLQDRQCACNLTLRLVWRKHWWSGKATVHSVCFPHYVTKGAVFEKKFLHTKCRFWFSLQLMSETFLFLRIIQQHIMNVRRSSCKYLLFLSNFNEIWILPIDFLKILKYQI
jgi:hypothetical protein